MTCPGCVRLRTAAVEFVRQWKRSHPPRCHCAICAYFDQLADEMAAALDAAAEGVGDPSDLAPETLTSPNPLATAVLAYANVWTPQGQEHLKQPEYDAMLALARQRLGGTGDT